MSRERPPVAPTFDDLRVYLADPVGQIEQECANGCTQKSVALTYALAMRDQDVVPVDWKRANAAIAKRWPKGLVRVKEMAWRRLRSMPLRETRP